MAAETFEGFDTEREFAKGKATLGGKAAFAEALEVFGSGVFRAVNDAEVFASAGFEGWLDEAAAGFGDEVERFDDHPFPSPASEFFPPTNAFGLAFRVGDIDELERCGHKEFRVGGAESGEGFHVPAMGLMGMKRAFAGKEMERGELEIGDGIHRPAVSSVGFDVVGDHIRAF